MKFLPVIIALVVAVFVGMMALQFLKKEEGPQQVEAAKAPEVVESTQVREIDVESVYVAARDIPIGTVLQPSDIDTQPWPKHLLVDGFVTAAEQGVQLKGMVTRAEFRAREPFFKSKMVNPDDPNFIAGSLPPGYRAFTIAVDNISGLSGFVFPGDRVDVVLTHRVYKEGVSERDLEDVNRSRDLEEDATEALVTNVKVLAVNQSSTVAADGQIPMPNSVTLQVTPEEVNRIRLGSEVGEISLALRSIKDKDDAAVAELVRKSFISHVGATSGSEATNDFYPVTVIRGTEVTGEVRPPVVVTPTGTGQSAQEGVE